MAARRSYLALGSEWVAMTILAILLSVIGVPFWLRFMSGVALAWLLVHMLIEGLVGRRCPECVDTSLVHSAGSPLGWRYARCASCGSRWYRSIMGSWQDARGAEHDRYFLGRGSRDPWQGGPVVDDATAGEGTHGALLQGKLSRLRKPRPDPVRPELPPGCSLTNGPGEG